jgi:hypothetical protein
LVGHVSGAIPHPEYIFNEIAMDVLSPGFLGLSSCSWEENHMIGSIWLFFD